MRFVKLPLCALLIVHLTSVEVFSNGYEERAELSSTDRAENSSLNAMADNGLGITLGSTDTITSNGITWDFDQAVTYGTFITGDYWIVGPVNVVEISNSLNSSAYTPRAGQNGSMLNPLVGHDRTKQGYDDGLTSYQEALNAGRPNGQPLTEANPLHLEPDDTLVSMVSWLYNSSSDKEPGTPTFNGGTQAPRPVTRTAGILTVLNEAPVDGSFRPAYVGNDNSIRYNFAQLDWGKLRNLTPPTTGVPQVLVLERQMEKPWIDHVFEYLGAMIHPSAHMPNYGRDMGHIVLETALMLQLDFSQLPGNPSKDQLLINLVQYGIDTTGIADNGGGWRANGGHGLGRKLPILIAGLILKDGHMQNVGTWGRNDGTGNGVGTEFQEYQNCFYVTQAEVDLTNSAQWAPDSRDVTAGRVQAYTEADIGTADWGIRHSYRPTSDNGHIESIYRSINAGVHPGMALAVHLMGAEVLWNHDAFLDYCDRIMGITGGGTGSNGLPTFGKEMWSRYRGDEATAVSYEDFLSAYFSASELLEEALVGNEEDPDGDGKNNLMEYVFQTDPRAPDREGISAKVDGGQFGVEVSRVSGVSKVNFEWEMSSTLDGTWEKVEPTGILLLEQTEGVQRFEYRFEASEPEANSFLRMLVQPYK